MQDDHVLKTLNYDLLPHPRVREGFMDKLFDTILLHLVSPFYLICTWPCSEKLEV